jgi:NitT/TauT family transport system ATP-binding protein
MKQRGALARALALESRVLLLDEPFPVWTHHAQTVRQALLRLWRERGFSAVFVTHDIGEALLLGTEIAVLTPGGLTFFNPSAPGLVQKLENAL